MIHIVSTSKKVKVISLQTVAPILMASRNPKEVIQEVPQPFGMELRFAANKAFQKLLAASKLMCKIYDLPFQELPDAMEQSGEEITESTDVIFCDPSYNMLQTANPASLEYDWLNIKYISVFYNVVSGKMYLGRRGHTTFSLLQFKLVVDVSRRDLICDGPTKEEDVLMSDDPPT